MDKCVITNNINYILIIYVLLTTFIISMCKLWITGIEPIKPRFTCG